jgi:hypothetical protein
MKTQAKDAVALAMDWLAQLRDEDSVEPPPGDGQPAFDSAPPTGDFGDAGPAARPAADWEDAAPAAPPAVDGRDARPALPPAADWEDAGLAVPPAVAWGDARPAAPPAADWEDAGPAALPATDFGNAAPAAHPAVAWGDARPEAPPAADSWRAAAPPATNPGPAAAVTPETTSPGRTAMKAEIEITERAAIGDELRIPLAWCEMGSCITHYADPAALGEADIRTRAIASGWRVDALGRLACPQCQQGDSWFWTAHPVVLWDRDTAVAMTTLMAAAVRKIAGADGAAGMERGAPPGSEPRPPLGRERPAPLGAEPGAIPGREPGAIPAAVPGPRPEMARPPGRGRHRGHPAHADRTQ